MRRIQSPPDTPATALERLLDLKTVQTHAPLSKQYIYRKVAEGSFPAPLKIGKARVAWRQSDIARWIARQTQSLPRGDSVNQCAA